jgi:ribosomal protein S18 acetylase RimI-like enzyme
MITIRGAEPRDVAAVLSLMRELAEHEGHLQYFVLDAETLHRFCFELPRRMELLVAEREGAIVGYATLLVQFSPWAAGEYLFLDDLYVSEDARGGGIGARLMRQVGAAALERGLEVRWHVEHENQAAQRFYRSLGAVLRDRLIAYWTVESIRTQARATVPSA